MMAYVRGAASSIDSSASLMPCNLSVLWPKDGSGEATFTVIHKHFAIIGELGSSSSNQKLVSLVSLEDKNPSSYLTQVSAHTLLNCRNFVGF